MQDVQVRRDLPDSVHQMRVAARRLRSGLRVFSPMVDPVWSRHLRDELGWAASELGLSRDSEVLLARLDAHADSELGEADAALIHEHVDPLMHDKAEAGRLEALEAMRSSAISPCSTPSSTPRTTRSSPRRRPGPPGGRCRRCSTRRGESWPRRSRRCRWTGLPRSGTRRGSPRSARGTRPRP